MNKVHNTKNLICVQTASKILNVVNNIFWRPFLPILDKIGDRTATKIPRSKDVFCGPNRVILQNFRPPGNSGLNPPHIFSEQSRRHGQNLEIIWEKSILLCPRATLYNTQCRIRSLSNSSEANYTSSVLFLYIFV